MKMLLLFLLLFYQTSHAASFKIFPEGQYKSLSDKCDDRNLRYINDDDGDILLFGPDVSIDISGPLKKSEKVPQGCSYQFEFTRSSQLIKRNETRTLCPNKSEEGQLSIVLEKLKDGNLQMIRRLVAADGKIEEEKCSYKKQ